MTAYNDNGLPPLDIRQQLILLLSPLIEDGITAGQLRAKADETLALISQTVSNVIGSDSNSLEMNPDAVGGYNHAKAEIRATAKRLLGSDV